MNKVTMAGLLLTGGLNAVPGFAHAFDYLTVQEPRTAYRMDAAGNASENIRVDDFFAPYVFNRAGGASAWLLDRRWPDEKANPQPSEMTVGYAWRGVRVEGSVSESSRRREKAMHFDSPKTLGLSSSLLSFNSSSNLTFQIRRGYLKRPDQLDPRDGVKRSTIATIYRHPLGGNQWQTMLAFGRSGRKADGTVSNALTLESLFQLGRAHTVFGRIERTTADELFSELDTLQGRNFISDRYTVGYVYDMLSVGRTKLTMGGLISKRTIPVDQLAHMGKDPVSGKVFVRLTMEMR